MKSSTPRRKRLPKENPKPWTARWPFRLLETFACMGAIILFVAGAVYCLKTAPEFRVQKVIVNGANKLSPQEINRLSGVTDQDCTLFLDTAAIQKRIMSQPYVRDCKVTRHFPDCIEIDIEEHTALATLMVNNRLFEVDDECNVLRELEPDKPHVGPFITNMDGLGYVEPGKKLENHPLASALAVWRAFGQTAMSREVTVSEISAAQENRICMYCNELDFEIRWGRDHLEKQASKLDIFWRSQRKPVQCKNYLDLRFGNDVACK